MIHIQHLRCGPITVAFTTNDVGEVTHGWGLTERSAERRLFRALAWWRDHE